MQSGDVSPLHRHQLSAIAQTHGLFTRSGIDYWLFGGWAVDFHAGSITRPHDDIDVAVWLDDVERIARLLGAEGWKHAQEPDEDGGTGYARDRVRLELTFLVPDDGGEVYIPLRAGRVLWSDEPLSTEFAELCGVRARVLGLTALKRGKSRARDDPVEAAKDRADFATLFQLGGITTVGALGTRGYMALELQHGAPPTPACDQYSLGVLAFELLTGELPFELDDDIRDVPKSMRLLAPGTSDAVREAVERALAPEPNARFPSVLALVQANKTSTEAFNRSQDITDSIGESRSASEMVASLTAHGLSDARIAEVADLERSQVLLLRRRAARRSIIGE